ncbi:PK beta-barrel-protein domain-containing protein-like protein [Xylariaceae sp. FL0662B]|nr:PK beta-barrel-protein domain-containing protein-like protein [Xylariaceae sp. FL0662B]
MGSDASWSDLDLAPLPPKDVLLSLRTGKIRPLGGVKGLFSAINKQPHQDKVRVTPRGLVGDERQYVHHLSADNALHQYDPRHYDAWKKSLPHREHKFKVGAFGENLSMAHLSESNLCIGDKFRLGPDAVIQVTMIRQPCYKLNHRFDHRKMSSLVQNTGRTGWYYRVLEEGDIQIGDEMELIERVNPHWPLSRLQHVLYRDMNNMKAISELCELPGLSEEFIELFTKRLRNGAENMDGRLQGAFAVPWRLYQLVEKTPLTPRIQRFVFAAAEDVSVEKKELQLGRFPHVRLRFGPDSKFTRAYSVVSGDMNSFELGIAKDDHSRGGSIYLHDNLNVGDVVEVAKGHTVSRKGDDQSIGVKRHIFILGGIGVTAFMSELKALEKTSAEVEIHYAVRSRDEAAYLDLLPPGKTTIYAKSEGRRLNVIDLIPPPKSLETMIYCCGPTSLLEACRVQTKKLGYPSSQVHFEEFGGAATGTGDPFEAEIKATGQVLQVPGEKSLLRVLNEAGFDVESSCLVGNCGTCIVSHCKGQILHQGVALEDEQKETSMLACVSRGRGRITIDC